MVVSKHSPTFGALLHSLRDMRRTTQMNLALDASISQRHLSFLEKGRSQPSRAMVLAISEALDLPFRERNDLLLAAGFAPMYEDGELTAPAMGQIRLALEMILKKHEPYPAVVMDRYWNLLMSNAAAKLLFGRMIDFSTVPDPPNLLRLMFDPALVRPFVRNWDEVARNLLDRLQNESVRGVIDSRTEALRRELSALAGEAAPSLGRLEDRGATTPVLPVRFVVGDLDLAYFSTVTSFGAPHEVTAQELRIECFFPADRATEEAATGIAEA